METVTVSSTRRLRYRDGVTLPSWGNCPACSTLKRSIEPMRQETRKDPRVAKLAGRAPRARDCSPDLPSTVQYALAPTPDNLPFLPVSRKTQLQSPGEMPLQTSTALVTGLRARIGYESKGSVRIPPRKDPKFKCWRPLPSRLRGEV